MKEKLKNKRGITLIALVITIIVLLILAGVTIATLMGDNGILTKATSSKTKTIHAEVYEGMQLETQSYLIEKNEGGYTGSLTDYLNRDESKPIIGENGIINVENLLGESKTLGNGTTIEEGDVYVLEETSVSTGDINKYKELEKVASVENIKVGATNNEEEKNYKVVYYGKTDSEDEELGILLDSENSSSASDTLEYEYLFNVDSNGRLTLNPTYSYYRSYYILGSENGRQLTNINLVIPNNINGQDVISIGGMNTEDDGNTYTFHRIEELTKVKIPKTVTKIEKYAFYKNRSLTAVQIPTSVTEIEYGAFNGTSLSTVYYEGTEEQWNENINKWGWTGIPTDVDVIYNYTGNDITESADVEATDDAYPIYANLILADLSQEEINELFYEGDLYWNRSNYESKYPGQEINKELIAKEYGYSSYEELLENIYLDRYDSLEDYLIKNKYIKPADYYGE